MRRGDGRRRRRRHTAARHRRAAGLSSDLGGEDLLDPLGDIAAPAAAGGRSAEPAAPRRSDEVGLERLTADRGHGHASSLRLVPKAGIERVGDLDGRPPHVCQHTPAGRHISRSSPPARRRSPPGRACSTGSSCSRGSPARRPARRHARRPATDASMSSTTKRMWRMPGALAGAGAASPSYAGERYLASGRPPTRCRRLGRTLLGGSEGPEPERPQFRSPRARPRR